MMSCPKPHPKYGHVFELVKDDLWELYLNIPSVQTYVTEPKFSVSLLPYVINKTRHPLVTVKLSIIWMLPSVNTSPEVSKNSENTV